MKRCGIFGWGVVAPKSPDIESFERNLDHATDWLTPFSGFGPSNFLVGCPEFDFSVYKPWLDQRFGPRRFSQLNEKMGNMAKYAMGAFIQALTQNPGIESVLQELETKTHIYVGTGLGDFPLQYEKVLIYYKAQKRWNRFWCREDHHPELAAYLRASAAEKHHILETTGAPPDPATIDHENADVEAVTEDWYAFWVNRSQGLKRYLTALKEIESSFDSQNVVLLY